MLQCAMLFLILGILLAFMIFFDMMETAILTIPRGVLLSLKHHNKSFEKIINIKHLSRDLVIIVFVMDIFLQFLFSFFLNRSLTAKSEIINLIIVLISSIVTIFLSILVKTFSISHATDCIKIFKDIFIFLFYICRPIGVFLGFISLQLLNLLGVKQSDNADELSIYKNEIYSSLESNSKLHKTLDESLMIKSILDLRELSIKQVMTPRNDFILAPYHENIEIFTLGLIPYSFKKKIIIYEENEDNIIGTVVVQDFFVDLSLNKIQNTKYYITPPKFFINTVNAYALLQYFRTCLNKFAFITDEYGSICGVATLSDIVAEIVGNTDEEDEYFFEKDGEGYITEGAMSIRLLNKKMNWSLPESHVTINGFIINNIKRIPSIDEEFVMENMMIRILEAKRNKIYKVYIKEIDLQQET